MPDNAPTPPSSTFNISWLRRLSAWLWGYDYFISYHWASGGAYAVALAGKLRALGYDVFLDRAEYAMGDDWRQVGERALRHTQRLVLVATREAVTLSQPVAHEVRVFTARGRQVIPVVFAEQTADGKRSTLADLDRSEHPTLGLMPDTQLYIEDDLANLARGPSDVVVEALTRTRWVMRRRDIRAMLILVAAAIVIGFAAFATVSWGNAVVARNDAEGAADLEKSARKRAETATDNEQKARAKTQDTLARSYLNTVGQQPHGALNPVEIDSLWQLAGLGEAEEPVRLAFLREILSTPGAAARMTEKLEYATHAATGLDTQRRDRVLREVILPTLKNEQATFEARIGATRLGVLLAASDSDFLAPALATATAGVRQGSLDRDRKTSAFLDRILDLTDVYERAHRRDDAEVTRLRREFLRARGEQAWEARDFSRLQSLAPNLDPKDAIELVDHMLAAKNTDSLRWLSNGGSDLASRLDPKDVAPRVKMLVNRLVIEKDTNVLVVLGAGVTGLSSRLDPDDAVAFATSLANHISLGKDTEGMPWQSESLKALCAKLPPKVAAALAAKMTDRVTTEKDLHALTWVCDGARALAGRLDPKDAAALADKLNARVVTEQNPDALYRLNEYAAALAGRLDPKDAAALATRLTDFLATESDRNVRTLSDTIVICAKRLDPEDAAALATRLIDQNVRVDAELAGRLDPKVAARLASKLLARLVNEKDPNARAWMFGSVMNLAGRLDPKDAAALATRLTDFLATESDRNVRTLSDTIVICAKRLDPEDAAALATRLIDQNVRVDAELAGRLDPKVAARLASKLLARLVNEKDEQNFYEMLDRVKSLIDLLPPEDTAPLTIRRANKLIDRLASERDEDDYLELHGKFVALAQRLSSKDTAKLATKLNNCDKENGNFNFVHRGYLSQSRANLVWRLNSEDAATLAAELIDTDELVEVALASQLDSKVAAEFATKLIGRMAAEKDGSKLKSQSARLGALAARLDSEDATKFCSKLLHQLNQIENPSDWHDPRYILLAQPIKSGRPWLAAAPPAESRRWIDRVLREPLAAAVGLEENQGKWLSAIEQMPLDDELPTCVLLLKAPTCIGVFREAMLKKAGRLAIGREFQTVWEFEAWARLHRPDLDFTSPPNRNP